MTAPRDVVLAVACLAAVWMAVIAAPSPAAAEHLTLEPDARPAERSAGPLEPSARPVEPSARPVEPGAGPVEPSALPFLSLVPRLFDYDINVRMDAKGFHVGGRLFGFGQSIGGWLSGRVRERGVTVDGQLQGDRSYNFRLDADTERGLPRLRIDAYPGSL